MIWNSRSSNMEKPNINKREWAMRFYGGTIPMQSNSERTCRLILGQVMDINCLTWIFNLVLVKQLFLANHNHSLHPIFHLLHLLLGQLCQCKWV
jgi:hypothetical protein